MKNILKFLIIFLFISFIVILSLFFIEKYKNYSTTKNIQKIEVENTSLKAEKENLQSDYDSFINENKSEYEELEKWEKINQEVEKYL